MFHRPRRLAVRLLAALTLSSGVQVATASETGLPSLSVSQVMGQAWSGNFGLETSSSRIHLSKHIASRNVAGQVALRKGRTIRLDGTSEAERLKSLIAGAEAGRLGYDAIHGGARRLPPFPPTRMTLGEILSWASATRGQPHAIGRYQFIPATLRDLIARTGMPLNTIFDRATQDRLADVLLHDAGFNAFVAGQIGRVRFMNNLAAIWAGLPTDTGRSAYHGYAGNYATISWADFDRHMTAIFN